MKKEIKKDKTRQEDHKVFGEGQFSGPEGPHCPWFSLNCVDTNDNKDEADLP